MAEHGAHITGVAESGIPSIFEVLAQESLITSLRPALNYALKVLAQNHPAKFGWLYSLGDELYTVLDFILENYYLKYYSASFAENFYGLKRSPCSKSGKVLSDVHKLTLSNHIRSLIFLVLVPYCKHKCDQLFERLQDQDDRGVRHSTLLKEKLCRAYLAVYPYVNALGQGLHFAFNLAFIFGKSRYHSPYLKWAGVVLQNLTADDIEKQQNWSEGALDFSGKSVFEKVRLLLGRGLTLGAVGLSHCLSLAVFFLQFLEWWHTSEQRTASLTALPIPDPPKRETVENLPKLNSICPLCNKMRTNDTLLAVTGYVFCYPCIYKFVKQNQRCPVTGMPVLTQHLVKLYLPGG